MQFINRLGLHIRNTSITDPNGNTWLFTYYTDNTSDRGRWKVRVVYPSGKVAKYKGVPYNTVNTMIASVKRVGCVTYKEPDHATMLADIVKGITLTEFRGRYSCNPIFALRVFRAIEKCRMKEGITEAMPPSLGYILSLLTTCINTLCQGGASVNPRSRLMRSVTLSK